MDELNQSLKLKIIEKLNLEDVAIEDIADDTPLFGEELGLDSIDILEIIVLLETDYGLKLADETQGKEVFQTIRTLGDFIRANQS